MSTKNKSQKELLDNIKTTLNRTFAAEFGVNPHALTSATSIEGSHTIYQHGNFSAMVLYTPYPISRFAIESATFDAALQKSVNAIAVIAKNSVLGVFPVCKCGGLKPTLSGCEMVTNSFGEHIWLTPATSNVDANNGFISDRYNDMHACLKKLFGV